MRAMDKTAKEKCWRDFYMKEVAQSPWGVVQWAKAPFGVRERMDGLMGDDGSLVRDDAGIVEILIGLKVFGEDSVVGIGGTCRAGVGESLLTGITL